MILDYFYSKNNKKLSVSYIADDGNKKILDFNIAKFKTYYYTPSGKYRSWDGANCDVKYTEDPSKFDIKTFFEELSPQYKNLLEGKTIPKLYTFDIETKMIEGISAGEAAQTGCAPILTISIASPDCNVMVLGTKKLDEEGTKYISDSFNEYITNLEYFNNLKMKTPYIKYIYFSSEREMLEYFLSKIVAKVPVLAGWNSILFDWQYIVNRIKNYYQDLSIQLSSCSYQVKSSQYTDLLNNKIILPMPRHTLILDMMNVVEKCNFKGIFDKAALNLDYVAHETVGANKIEYEGDLQSLYETDYKKYIYYNAIDSVLVQLIDKRFKDVENICLQSLYCSINIESAFSKIAITEALVFKDFYKSNLKIVYEERNNIERGKLLGAYVKDPIPGKYQYVACNDFASLYPSTIITCNLSFENFIGYYYKEDELKKYIGNPAYIVIGPDVFKNAGTYAHPELGELLYTFIDHEKLKQFEGKPEYFVTVKGSVYRNDKDYSFRRIQKTVKADRGISKYLGKELDAKVMLDIEHIEKGHKPDNIQYSTNVVNCLKGLGYNITCTNDIYNFDLQTLKRELKTEIEWHDGNQLAMKLIGNSMYGGSSHISFYWYNMALANDITGESRNLINKMERHIPEFIKENWEKLTDLHEELGIKLNKQKCKDIHNKDESFIKVIYGDSCTGDTLISTVNGDIKIEDLFNDSNIIFVDRDKEFAKSNIIIKNFNGRNIINSKIKYVIRHKTSKSKWKIIDTNNNYVEVTGDHSMIIMDNEIMKIIKPSEMVQGMVLLTTTGLSNVKDVINLGNFNDEFVYDIEVDTNNDNEHNFFGNNILIHNTDSVIGDTIIHTDNGDKTIEQMFNENYENNRFFTHNGHELVSSNDKVLNWNNKLDYTPVNYIMRHKVTKPKWKLKTKSGQEVIVTNDHSMIVFRDGEKLEVKPYEIQPSDKILVVKKTKDI